MRNLIKCTFLILATVLLLVGCNSDKENNRDSDVNPSSVSNVDETKSVDELKTEIIGQWGRLDEAMHYFMEDKRCVIGGMQGTYDIDDESKLVLTTMSGSVTIYDWASSRVNTTSEHYWYLVGDTMKIDGNEFTKIYGKETPEYLK